MLDELVSVRYTVDDVEDNSAEVERLRAASLTFRDDIVTGLGGQQILLEDPSGHPIELFQPAGA